MKRKKGNIEDVRFALVLDGPVPGVLSLEYALELESETFSFPVCDSGPS